MNLVVEARSKFSIWFFIFLFITLFVIVISLVMSSYQSLLLAIPTSLCALFLWLTKTRSIHLTFNEDGIHQASPPLEIPWSSIDGVRRQFASQDFSKNISRPYQLEIHHFGGIVLVPSQANPALETVAKALVNILPATGSREVPDVLEDNKAAWLQTFGEDMVFTYKARRRLGISTHWPSLAILLGLMLGGLIILGITIALQPKFNKGDDGAVLASLLAIFPFLLILLIYTLSVQNSGANRKIKKWKNAGLVISPMGLAMTQGNMEGEMKWSEILELDFQKKKNMGIRIKIAGAEFQIFDLYDRPLFVIYQQMMKYWANKTVAI